MVNFYDIGCQRRQGESFKIGFAIIMVECICELAKYGIDTNAFFNAGCSQRLFSSAAKIEAIVFENPGCLKVVEYDL